MVKKIKQKYQNMTLPVKASIWFVACSVLKDAVDIIMTPIFTRILTTEQYGVFNVYNSWFQIVKIMFTLFVFGEVFNVGLVKFEKERDRFVSATLGFVTTSVAVYLVVYIALHNLIDKVIGLPGYLIFLLFAHVLVYVPYYCWIRRERFDYHYRNVVIVSAAYVILQPVTAIWAIRCLDLPIDPGHTRVIATVGVQIIIGVILYLGMMCRGRKFYDGRYWKYSLKTGVVLVPFNLSKVVLNQSDRIMINYYSGAGDTAVYSVAHSAAFVLQAVFEAINGAFVPWLYRKLKACETAGIKGTVNGLLVLASAGVIGVEIIAPEIMHILGDEAYYKGIYCVPALVYSVYLIFVYSLFTNVELFYGKNSYVTISSIVGMVVNIILNWIFIPRYGFVAAGYTTLVGYGVICLGHYILLKKCLKKENMRVSDILDMRIIIAISLILFIFTLLSGILYQLNAIRWIVISVLALIIFFTKNKWWGLLRLLKGDD